MGYKTGSLIVAIVLIYVFTGVSPVSGQSQEDPNRNWHDRMYRKLFFDYHNHKNNWGLAQNFNAEEWAGQLEEAGAEGVSMFAKGAQGWRYYRKGDVGWIHPGMPEGLDMLGEVVEACHKRGIKVIAYYHTFSSSLLEESHPDWRSMNSKKDPSGLCMKTPLLEEHILPQAREIVKNYDIDGIFFDGTNIRSCHCQYCKSGFKNDTGHDIPMSGNDPQWLAYNRWLSKESTLLRRKIIDAVHKERPDVLVSFNWSYTPRQPEIPPEDLGFLMCDIFPEDQLFAGSYLGKYWSTLGISFDIMNSAFLRWWGDWGCKPAVAMQQECATIIANGGKTWLGHMMPAQFGVEPAIMHELGETMKFIEEREEYCRDSEPVPYIAVLHSTQYISGDIFGAYALRNNWNLKNMFGNLVNMVLPEKLVTIESPGTVEVVLKRQHNKTQVHLINHSGDRSFNNTIAYSENIIPVHGIEVRVKTDSLPQSVLLMPEGQKLSFKSVENGTISVFVPKLDIYSIIVIE